MEEDLKILGPLCLDDVEIVKYLDDAGERIKKHKDAMLEFGKQITEEQAKTHTWGSYEDGIFFTEQMVEVRIARNVEEVLEEID